MKHLAAQSANSTNYLLACIKSLLTARRTVVEITCKIAKAVNVSNIMVILTFHL